MRMRAICSDDSDTIITGVNPTNRKIIYKKVKKINNARSILSVTKINNQ